MGIFTKVLTPEVIKAGNWIILDTETTGLYAPEAEIVQLAIVDLTGTVLLNTLVKPVNPIPPGATRIHGITDPMVANAPTWYEIGDRAETLIKGKQTITYNADYDRRMFESSDMQYLTRRPWGTLSFWHCAMLWYAQHRGDWNRYRKSFKWHKLTDAMAYERIPVSDAHSALGDCLMTLALINKLLVKP